MTIKNTLDKERNVLVQSYFTDHTGTIQLLSLPEEVEFDAKLYKITRLGMNRIITAQTAGLVTDIVKDVDGNFAEYGTRVLSLERALTDFERHELEEEERYTILRAEYDAHYYITASPKEPQFKSIGDIVRDGDVLMIAERMKMFSEIPYHGPDMRVAKVYIPKNGAHMAGAEKLYALETIVGDALPTANGGNHV